MILLVRHGQASWGAEDYDELSATGHEQSRVLGRALAGRGVRPTRVVSGSMRRHAQTARAVLEGAAWAHEVVQDPGWDEFDHVQVLDVHGPPPGADPAELGRRELDAWFDAATDRWTAGGHDHEYAESFPVFAARVEAAFARLAGALGSGETAVVLSSGGPVAWVASTLLGGGLDTWSRLNPVTVNASVSKVVVGSRGTTLVSVNEHAHLEPDLVTYR